MGVELTPWYLRRYFSTPHYFPLSAAEWKPEWIYFGTKGSGVDRHIDKMCSAKWSVQVRGEKEWILSSGLERRPARYRTVLQPGDILLFYPQCVHSGSRQRGAGRGYTVC